MSLKNRYTNYKKNYIMPSLITPLTRSHTINKTKGEKSKQQNKQKEKKTFFTAKIQHLNLKAPSNNVKIQSEAFLNYSNLLFRYYKADGTLY